MEKKVRYIKITTANSWEYFAHASGGSNRKWTARYIEMMEKYRTLKKIPKLSKEYIDGFEECLSTFHRKDCILIEEKE